MAEIKEGQELFVKAYINTLMEIDLAQRLGELCQLANDDKLVISADRKTFSIDKPYMLRGLYRLARGDGFGVTFFALNEMLEDMTAVLTTFEAAPLEHRAAAASMLPLCIGAHSGLKTLSETYGSCGYADKQMGIANVADVLENLRNRIEAVAATPEPVVFETTTEEQEVPAPKKLNKKQKRRMKLLDEFRNLQFKK